MAKQTIATIRKREIVDTFYEVAQVEGIENTSFAKIAQRLEIQPSLIVHYFKIGMSLYCLLLNLTSNSIKKYLP